MTTIREYLACKTHTISAQIFGLKQKALKDDGFHISPKSADWAKYLALKRECSLYLTMSSMVKWWNDFIPTKKEAIELFHSRGFANHARKGRPAKSLYFKAFRRLQKIGNNLSKHVRALEPELALWQRKKQEVPCEAL